MWYDAKTCATCCQQYHILVSNLPIPTQYIRKSFEPIPKTNRNITVDYYFSSMALATSLKEVELMLVGEKIKPNFLNKKYNLTD